MTDTEKKLALLLATSPYIDTLDGKYETAAMDLAANGVVPVVRCKECIHWNKDALACDTLPRVDSSEHANWYAEDFCSYGERRTE